MCYFYYVVQFKIAYERAAYHLYFLKVNFITTFAPKKEEYVNKNISVP